MSSLCSRLFTMVHGCWQSISSCGMISTLSHPDSRFDPIGGSEPSSGCENIYWDSLPA